MTLYFSSFRTLVGLMLSILGLAIDASAQTNN